MASARERFGVCRCALQQCRGVLRWRRCWTATQEEYERTFDVNVKGMFFVMQAVLRQMVGACCQGAA